MLSEGMKMDSTDDAERLQDLSIQAMVNLITALIFSLSRREAPYW